MTWATGAAVAVRHERRRHEKRSTAACTRPTELNLPTSPISYSSSPILPQTSPSGGGGIPEIYICKFQVPLLQIIVVSLVLGAILLIVGLVQLKPGAGASQHKFLLLGSGIFLLIFGILLAFIRCCLLPWTMKQKRRKLLLDEETALQNGLARTRTPSHTSLQTPSHVIRPTPTSTTTTSIVPPHQHHHHTHHQKATPANHHTHGKSHGEHTSHHHHDDKGSHSNLPAPINDVHLIKPIHTPNGEIQDFDSASPHPTCSITVDGTSHPFTSAQTGGTVHTNCSIQVETVADSEERGTPPHCVLLVTEPSPSDVVANTQDSNVGVSAPVGGVDSQDGGGSTSVNVQDNSTSAAVSAHDCVEITSAVDT